MLYARDADRAPLCGVVIGKDSRNKVLVLERDGIACTMQIDAATAIYGVDGYPVSVDDVHVGGHVEVVQ